MSAAVVPSLPLSSLRQALPRFRAELPQCRSYAAAVPTVSGLKNNTFPKYRLPDPGFRPSQAIKQNRLAQLSKKIRIYPQLPSAAKACPDPISVVFQHQLKALDPTGARSRLFSPKNPERVQPGDILLVRFKSGDPYSGVVLCIRQRNSPVDTSVLLRNQLTRVGTEMWIKVYSPNVQGIEIAHRREKRARRAKLYYMRQPRHDIGSVESIVRNYIKQRSGGVLAGRGAEGRNANSGRKNSKRGKR